MSKYVKSKLNNSGKRQRRRATFDSLSFKMTRMLKWLFYGVLFLSIWLALVTRKINHRFLDEHQTFLLYLPFGAIFLFGVFSALIILWRIYTFNDCKEAALELKEQIEEAKADLKARGFQFSDAKS